MHGPDKSSARAPGTGRCALRAERSANGGHGPGTWKDRWGARLIPLARAYIRHLPIRAGKVWFWTHVVDARLAWLSHEFRAATIFGRRIAGNSRDIIQQYIYWFGVWEPNLTRWIQQRLQPGDAFVDVGANIGYFSLLAAALVGDGGAVVAIEASPQTFRALEKNLALNRIRNVRAVNLAAADREGTLQLYRGPDCNSGVTSTIATAELVYECDIAAAPLPALLQPEEMRRARLIKIDVEGAEWSVVAGLRPAVPCFREDLEVIVEVNPEHLARQGKSPDDLIQIFAGLGFHAYRVANDYAAVSYLAATGYQRPVRVHAPIQCESDLIFSRVDAPAL